MKGLLTDRRHYTEHFFFCTWRLRSYHNFLQIFSLKVTKVNVINHKCFHWFYAQLRNFLPCFLIYPSYRDRIKIISNFLGLPGIPSETENNLHKTPTSSTCEASGLTVLHLQESCDQSSFNFTVLFSLGCTHCSNATE